jgi:hypothetical protein
MLPFVAEHAEDDGIVDAAGPSPLKQQITQLTEHNQHLRASLAERDQDLAAARAANRELMARLNTRG